jgi:hypothetical protein
MYKREIDFLNFSSISTEEQFGFSKGLATDKAFYKFIIETLCALNDKMHVGGIFCVLAKAFDCVNHDILLSKYNFCGIQGKTGQWFKSHNLMAKKKKRVEIKSPNSGYDTYWGVIKHGVLQGLVLGPLLFLLYINDLLPTINSQSKPILFADDTSIIYHPDSD